MSRPFLTNQENPQYADVHQKTEYQFSSDSQYDHYDEKGEDNYPCVWAVVAPRLPLRRRWKSQPNHSPVGEVGHSGRHNRTPGFQLVGFGRKGGRASQMEAEGEQTPESAEWEIGGEG